MWTAGQWNRVRTDQDVRIGDKGSHVVLMHLVQHHHAVGTQLDQQIGHHLTRRETDVAGDLGDAAALQLGSGGRGGDRDPVPPSGGGEVLPRSEEHTSELQSRGHLVCRLLLDTKKYTYRTAR